MGVRGAKKWSFDQEKLNIQQIENRNEVNNTNNLEWSRNTRIKRIKEETGVDYTANNTEFETIRDCLSEIKREKIGGKEECLVELDETDVSKRKFNEAGGGSQLYGVLVEFAGRTKPSFLSWQRWYPSLYSTKSLKETLKGRKGAHRRVERLFWVRGQIDATWKNMPQKTLRRP